ncbi:MAG: YihY/virulence factor BrkB family protein [Oligoflexia bacterium]|nr:YihY/virulence factor BrkB family protein [Oligoflexia bacterium]
MVALINDNIFLHCAALAYYTLFSIAPLLLISIAIAGLFFGPQASRGEIFETVRKLLGESGSTAVERMVHQAAANKHTGIVATWGGFGALVFGASQAFAQLVQSLNLIWKVESAPGRGMRNFLRKRLLSFSMILVIGFILLVSMIASAALSAMGSFFVESLPGGEFFWHAANFVISFGVITLLFAAIFKILPDVKLRWSDVWLGAALTTFLFNVGELLIGLYLGKSSISSTYGAAGSLMAVLLWVFYSSAILYFGAEFTKIYSEREGRRLEPKAGAQFIHQQAA